MRAIRLTAAAIVLAALSTLGASAAQAADSANPFVSTDGWNWVSASGWNW